MKHVLLLEDDAYVSSILVRLLDEEKYYVSTTTRVGNAREFLEWVKVDLDSTQTSMQTSIRSGRSAARACIRSLEEHAQTDGHSIRLFAPNFCFNDFLYAPVGEGDAARQATPRRKQSRIASNPVFASLFSAKARPVRMKRRQEQR